MSQNVRGKIFAVVPILAKGLCTVRNPSFIDTWTLVRQLLFQSNQEVPDDLVQFQSYISPDLDNPFFPYST